MPSKRLKLIKDWNWGGLLHGLYNLALPAAVLFLVRFDLVEISIVLVILSKWRTFTVNPRHLVANIRTNATDFIVNLGTLAFIIESDTLGAQIGWTIWYAVWLLLIKPRSTTTMVGLQAFAGQAIGLSALMQYSNDLSLVVVLFLAWIIGFSVAHHFLSSYEEPWAKVIAHSWGLFVLQLSWILFQWTLVYVIVPQIVLILSIISFAFAHMYDSFAKGELKSKIIYQHLLMTSILLAVLLIMADWQGQI
jgi:hypothetical protein